MVYARQMSRLRNSSVLYGSSAHSLAQPHAPANAGRASGLHSDIVGSASLHRALDTRTALRPYDADHHAKRSRRTSTSPAMMR